MTGRRVGLVLVCLAVTLAGCRTDSEPDRTDSPSSPTEAAPGALELSVEITFPRPDMPVDAPEVLVALTVRGSFSIVDKIGESPTEGEGHLIFYLDVDEIPKQAGRSALVDGSQAVAGTSHRWKGVEPGEHKVGVQLVNNDDTPLDPPVTDEVDITVRSA